MVREIAGQAWEEKPKFEKIKFPKAHAKSGDLILITRFDGVDQIIESFTGSKVAHTTIVLEKNGEKYICESQMALYFPR